MFTSFVVGFVLGAIAAVAGLILYGKRHLKEQAAQRSRGGVITAKDVDDLNPLSGIRPIDKHWAQRHGNA